MCIFCASIPVTVSVGASLSVKQKEGQHSLTINSKSTSHKNISIGKVTLAIVVGLITASIFYHSVIVYRIGI